MSVGQGANLVSFKLVEFFMHS